MRSRVHLHQAVGALAVGLMLLVPQVWGVDAHVLLEMEIVAPQADELATQMQEALNAVRAAYGLTLHTARAGGISIYPRVLHAKVVGYRATDRLALPLRYLRGNLSRAREVLSERGVTVTVVAPGTPRQRGDTWTDQWLQFG